MEHTAIGLLTLATILMGVMVILSIIAITYLYHYFSGMADQHQTALNLLHDEISSISTEMLTLREKVELLERRPDRLDASEHSLESVKGKDKDIEKAKQLLDKGAGLDVVIEECQLAQGEADLVRLANQMDRLASVGS